MAAKQALKLGNNNGDCTKKNNRSFLLAFFSTLVLCFALLLAFLPAHEWQLLLHRGNGGLANSTIGLQQQQEEEGKEDKNVFARLFKSRASSSSSSFVDKAKTTPPVEQEEKGKPLRFMSNLFGKKQNKEEL